MNSLGTMVADKEKLKVEYVKELMEKDLSSEDVGEDLNHERLWEE